MAIPIVVVSGGLGSGKTTLLKAIVAANPALKFGIVVNEFGEMGVDGDLLRPFVPEIVEIRNGCICCATQDQLAPAIKEILRRYAVDVMLLEMSGAAEPSTVLHELRILAPLVEIASHAVLVDGTANLDLATRDRAFRTAIGDADVLAITKIDIASAPMLDQWTGFLRTINGRAALVLAANGDVPLDALTARRLRLGRTERDEGVRAHEPGAHPFTSVCQFVDAVTQEHLRSFVLAHGENVIRIKGIVPVDGAWSEVQVVRGDLRIVPYMGTPPARGRLVFISAIMHQHELRRAIRNDLQ